jgi:hypothetical protein
MGHAEAYVVVTLTVAEAEEVLMGLVATRYRAKPKGASIDDWEGPGKDAFTKVVKAWHETNFGVAADQPVGRN